MELLKSELPSNCDIALIGDNHTGSRLEYKEAVRKCLDWIMSDPNRYYIHMGDAIEAICVDDKRYKRESEDSKTESVPLLQSKDVISDFRHTRDRCIAWLMGNHEMKLWRFANLTRDVMCDQLNVPYGGYSCAITFNDKHGKMFKGHFRHGIGSTLTSNAKDEEQRIANMKATLKMRLKRKAGDCILMACGDTHKLLIVPPVKTLFLTDDGVKLRQHYMQPDPLADFIDPNMRWYVNTGTFRKSLGLGFTDYAEEKGFDPIIIGHAIVEIRDRKITNIREVEFE